MQTNERWHVFEIHNAKEFLILLIIVLVAINIYRSFAAENCISIFAFPLNDLAQMVVLGGSIRASDLIMYMNNFQVSRVLTVAYVSADIYVCKCKYI